MSFCRRDTARNLLKNLGDTDHFLDSVAAEVDSLRVKPKLAEKIVIMYNQDPNRLYTKLDNSINS